MKEEPVLFYLVGQRALVSAFVRLQASGEAPLWSSEADIGLERYENCLNDFYANFLVTAFNELYASGRELGRQIFHRDAVTERREGTGDLAAEFWAGSLVERDAPDKMNFSQSAAFRGGRWIVFLSFLYWFCEVNDVSESKIIASLEDFVYNRDGDATNLSQYPFGKEVRESFAKVVGDRLEGQHVYNHPMTYLVQGLEEEQRDMDKVREAGLQRLEYVLQVTMNAVKSG